jgi:hypothetical protein
MRTFANARKIRTLFQPHNLQLCVSLDTSNNQRLFPSTALNGLVFIMKIVSVYCEVRTAFLYTEVLEVKTCGRHEDSVEWSSFLTSALYWDERSASRLNYFTCWIRVAVPTEEAAVRASGWVRTLKKRQNSYPCRDSNLHFLVVQSATWSPYELRHPPTI